MVMRSVAVRFVMAVAVVLGLSGSPAAWADGPVIGFQDKRGECADVPGKDYCELKSVRPYFVRAADGSVVQFKVIARKASYKEIEKTSAQMGDKIRGRDKQQKENLDGALLVGLADAAGNVVEPPVYNQIVPISDKMALATAYLNDSNSGYEYHLVPIDGKVTKSAGTVGEREAFYYIGGYWREAPAVVMTRGPRNDSTGLREVTLVDAYGKPKARHDNIITDNDLGFFVFETGEIVARAHNPETNEEGSVRFGPDGEIKGYGPKIAFKDILVNANGSRFESNALMVVGRMPVVSSLPDETLYHPLAPDLTKMPAPDNFIGMARMFTYDHNAAKSGRQQNWVLVYRTETGFGYKVAGEGTRGRAYNMPLRTAQSVLKSEADFRMYSGFGFTMERIDPAQPSRPKHAQYVVQEYTAYEPDGITPAAGAVPGQWRDMTLIPASYTNLTGKGGDNLGKQTYATAEAAFKEGWRRVMAERAEKAAWERKLAQELAEAKERAARERLVRMEEMRRHFEEQQRYRPAQPQRENALSAFLGGLVGGLNAAADRQMRENANIPRNGYVTDCYAQGDGYELCFTKPR